MHEELVQVVRSHEQILRDSPRPYRLHRRGNQRQPAALRARKGRYAKYADTDIPALRKCQQNLPKSHLDAQLNSAFYYQCAYQRFLKDFEF